MFSGVASLIEQMIPQSASARVEELDAEIAKIEAVLRRLQKDGRSGTFHIWREVDDPAAIREAEQLVGYELEKGMEVHWPVGGRVTRYDPFSYSRLVGRVEQLIGEKRREILLLAFGPRPYPVNICNSCNGLTGTNGWCGSCEDMFTRRSNYRRLDGVFYFGGNVRARMDEDLNRGIFPRVFEDDLKVARKARLKAFFLGFKEAEKRRQKLAALPFADDPLVGLAPGAQAFVPRRYRQRKSDSLSGLREHFSPLLAADTEEIVGFMPQWARWTGNGWEAAGGKLWQEQFPLQFDATLAPEAIEAAWDDFVRLVRAVNARLEQ
jgi:hypothetical protein